MEKIPLTNYQLIAYFVPGFILEFCLFLSFERVVDYHSLLCRIEGVSIPLMVIFLFLAFAIGLVLDGIRNGIVDNLLDLLILIIPPGKYFKVNWDFFHKGKPETVGYFYARYFTYYCFDFNMILSICVSLWFLNHPANLIHLNTVNTIGLASAIFLFLDAISLRWYMRKATDPENIESDCPKKNNQ
jgi:hypothetical protein